MLQSPISGAASDGTLTIPAYGRDVLTTTTSDRSASPPVAVEKAHITRYVGGDEAYKNVRTLFLNSREYQEHVRPRLISPPKVRALTERFRTLSRELRREDSINAKKSVSHEVYGEKEELLDTMNAEMADQDAQKRQEKQIQTQNDTDMKNQGLQIRFDCSRERKYQ